jgi:hypothetical protein
MNNMLFVLIAWLYGPIGAGALVVFTAFIIVLIFGER